MFVLLVLDKAINMKLHLTSKALLLLFAFGILSSGCQTETKKTNNTKHFDNSDAFNSLSDGFTDTFYRIPSPEDLFDLVSAGNVAYEPSVLNPTINVEKYIDTKSKEFNFGVYSADLAYTSAFQRYQESYDYIETVRKLSSEIGISSVFDEATLARVHNIFENSDSLMNVTNNTYRRFVRHLEQNDRGKTLALVSAGGWVESLYIVVNLVGEYKENDINVQRIADQKLTFENLMDYLIQYKSDKNISSILIELSSIKEAYDSLKKEKTDKEATKKQGDTFVVGGNSKIVITKEQFEALKIAIVKVRTKLALNE
jgi:hypothetical protein